MVNHGFGGDWDRRRMVRRRNGDASQSAWNGERRPDGNSPGMARRDLRQRSFLLLRLLGIRLGRRLERLRHCCWRWRFLMSLRGSWPRWLCRFFALAAGGGRFLGALPLSGADINQLHASSQLLRDVLVNRTGVGLLVPMTHLMKDIEQDSGFNLEFSCQFVDTGLLHIFGRLQSHRAAADPGPALSTPRGTRPWSNGFRQDCSPTRPAVPIVPDSSASGPSTGCGALSTTSVSAA